MDPFLDSIRSSPARQRYAAMFGTRAPEPSREDPAMPYLEEETKEDMLSYLTRQTGGALQGAGKALDTPGAIFRGVLAGDPLSGFSWDDERRVSGKELLEQYGLISKNANPYASHLAGLAAEVALDPLGIAKLPLKALTTAGRAADAAGLLDKASDAWMAKKGFEEATRLAQGTRTGRAAYKFLGDLLPAGKGINPKNAAYRPLIGPRVARTEVSLDDVVKVASDPALARKQIDDYLIPRGKTYDAVKDQPLGGAFGIGYYNAVDPIIFNPAAARPYLDALDYAGQAARWSAPARAISAFADQRVDGALKPRDQLMQMKKFDRVARETAEAQEKFGEHVLMAKNIELPEAAQKILGTDSLLSEEGTKFTRRFFENVQTASDMRLRDIIGPEKIDALVDNWHKNLRASNEAGAKALGMRVAASQGDKFGVLPSPRRARELEFDEYGKGEGRRNLNTRTREMESRNPDLLTPGGTVDRNELSLLPVVQKFYKEGRESGLSVNDVARAVKEYIDTKHGPGAVDPRAVPFKTFVPQLGPDGNPLFQTVFDDDGALRMVKARTKTGRVIIDPATGKPKMVPRLATVKNPNEVITPRSARKIAREMMRMNPNLDEGVGLFSEHPIKAQGRTMMSQAVARGNADHLLDSVAEAAIRGAPGKMADDIIGTQFKPLDRALAEIAVKTGLSTRGGGKFASRRVENIIRERIAKAEGISPESIDLARYSFPEEELNRIVRTSDFYSTPRFQQDVTTAFDSLTSLFKGFVLAFPATKVRDFYSNVFLVWTQAGNGIDVVQGMRAANKVLAGRLDDAVASLKEIPAYANAPDAASLQQMVVRDVSRTGVLRSLASNDLLTNNQNALLNQFVPGSAPIRAADWFRELIPDGTRTGKQMLSDFAQVRGVQLPGQKAAANVTRNSILNASQKASDWTDSVARLGGMFALMRQGVSAEEAARRITSALVDYGSLTLLERQTLRRLFPWYAFQSRIGKYVAQQILQNPGGGYAQTIRAFNVLQNSDDDTYLPESVRQQFAFRVPDAWKPYLGIDPGTNTLTVLKDFDIPGFDVMSLLGPEPTPYGTVQSTAYNLLQQVHPVARSLVELGTGIDTFTRRPLEQAVTPLDRLYKRVTGSPNSMNPLLRQAINVLPGPQQRLIGIAGGLADDRLPLRQRIAKQTFNTLAGIKLQDIDPAWQLQDARRVLARELGGFLQDYTESYVPKDKIPKMPLELLPKYQLYRTLGRDLRESRK